MRLACSWTLAVLLAVGCDGDPADEDAGTEDAGPLERLDGGPPPPDAGHDAGPRDAAPFDAGELAPVEMAAMDVESELRELSTMYESIPPSTLASASTLEVDLSIVGIDQIIGETGIQTLVLTDPAVRALADLEQTNRLIRLINSAIGQLVGASEASLVLLQQQAMALRDALTVYHEELEALFRQRYDTGDGSAPEPIHEEVIFALVTNQPWQLDAFVEGSVTTPNATVGFECPPAFPSTLFDVLDVETGELLVSSETSAAPVEVPAAGGKFLRIAVAPIYRVVGEGGTCIVRVRSPRVLRATPVHYADTEIEDAFSLARGATILLLDTIAARRTAGGSAPSTLDTCERIVTWMDNILGGIHAVGYDGIDFPIAIEDLERTLRLFAYADVIFQALIDSRELTGTIHAELRSDAQAALNYYRQLVLAVRAAM
jgi:hypothetical protein